MHVSEAIRVTKNAEAEQVDLIIAFFAQQSPY